MSFTKFLFKKVIGDRDSIISWVLKNEKTNDLYVLYIQSNDFYCKMGYASQFFPFDVKIRLLCDIDPTGLITDQNEINAEMNKIDNLARIYYDIEIPTKKEFLEYYLKIKENKDNQKNEKFKLYFSQSPEDLYDRFFIDDCPYIEDFSSQMMFKEDYLIFDKNIKNAKIGKDIESLKSLIFKSLIDC